MKRTVFSGLRSYRMNVDNVRNGNGHKSLKQAFETRTELKKANKIVVKLGSAVVTKEDQSGVALGRLASVVEQVSSLQNEGREMLIVSSGSVAFGRQRLNTELRMSMSMRETLQSGKGQEANSGQAGGVGRSQALQAAAAVGQSSLMALYESMFSQFGVRTAQVLVTKPDFYNPLSRVSLRTTFTELLGLNIVPIVNTNDAVFPLNISDHDLDSSNSSHHPPLIKFEDPGVSLIFNQSLLWPLLIPSSDQIVINDNDSLAAHLAVEVGADLLILMSDVDGVYNLPPGTDGSRLLKVYSPKHEEMIRFGERSTVGSGGMESKVKSAFWALDRGVSVVICNGSEEKAISKVISGKQIGTFFTNATSDQQSVETIAANGESFRA